MQTFSIRYKELQTFIIIGLILFLLYYYFFIFPHNFTKNSIPAQIRFGGMAENGKVQVIAEFNADELQALWIESQNIPPNEANFPIKTGDTHITPSIPCSNLENAQISWLIYAISEVANVERRQALRSTWANKNLFKNPFFRVIFVVGQTSDPDIQSKLLSESLTHGDILQSPVVDGDRTATQKTITALAWVSENCGGVKYVLKCMDSSFINVFELMPLVDEKILSAKDKERVIICGIWGENLMPIQRDPAKCGNYCVKKDEFPGRTHYPQYCAGTGVVMTIKVVAEMNAVVKDTATFWIEDVYLTGLLAPKITPAVQYIDIINNLNVDSAQVRMEYEDKEKPVKIFIAQLNSQEMFDIWKLALAKISPTAFKLLSNEAISLIT